MDTAGLFEERCSSPGLLLALLGHYAMRRLRAAHTKHELSPRQFQLLALLHDRGPMGQRELGQVMETDPSILVTLLNPLEAEGLLSRQRDEQDRRRHLVTLTGRGRATARRRRARTARSRGGVVRGPRPDPARAAQECCWSRSTKASRANAPPPRVDECQR